MYSGIQYIYAIGETGELISIDSLDDISRKQKFVCPECSHPLIPKMGRFRQHHFAHKYVDNCNPETYLHKIGKKLLYDNLRNRIENNLPFYIELMDSIECVHSDPDDGGCIVKRKKRHDLLAYFNKVHLEKKHDGFVPDVQLTNEKGDVIYLEIKVTHASEDAKMYSGHRLIEFDISNEEDLELVTGDSLQKSNRRVHLMNFQEKEFKEDLCNKRCDKEMDVFMLFESGKSRIREVEKFRLRYLNNQCIHHKVIGPTYGGDWETSVNEEYVTNVIAAHQQSLKIKNCFLCRYHAHNRSYQDGSIFCKYLKKAGSSNMAADCSAYRPDEKVYSKYIKGSTY